MNVHGICADVPGESFVELIWRPTARCRLERLFVERRDWEGEVSLFLNIGTATIAPEHRFLDRVPARLFAEGIGFRLDPEIDGLPGREFVMRVTNCHQWQRAFAGAWIGENVSAMGDARVVRCT